jgi:hypothetical protein
MAAGARGLSPLATAGWGLTRLTGRPPASVIENSSFTWSVATASETTLVWVHNYWSDGYGIDRPHLTAALLGTDGRAVRRWSFTLAPDATEVIDVRQVCREARIALPFEGQLLLQLRHEKLFAGRPLQTFGEYVKDDGEASGVHGQYGWVGLPAAQMVSTIRVEAGPDRRTAIVMVNPYDGPGAPVGMRTRLTVADAEGRSRSARLGVLPAGASRRLYLDDVFDDLPEFLGGQPGHARVLFPCPVSRLATFVEFDDGRRIVNHGTVDRVYHQGSGIPPNWTESEPMASAFVIVGDGQDTVLTLVNVWGPVAASYEAAISVYDTAGQIVGSVVEPVPAGALRSVRLGDVIAAAGRPGRFVGHAEVRLLAPQGLSERPAQLDVLVGLTRDGALQGEVQVGGEFFNAPVPPGISLPDVRRTRTFGRVRVDGQARTFVHLGYPAPREEQRVSTATMTLVDTGGAKVAVREVAIPAHGAAFGELTEFFPEASRLLGSGSGVLRVRDTEARLYGFYFVETDGASTGPICHLIGG